MFPEIHKARRAQEVDRESWPEVERIQFDVEVLEDVAEVLGPYYFGRAYEEPPFFTYAFTGTSDARQVTCGVSEWITDDKGLYIGAYIWAQTSAGQPCGSQHVYGDQLLLDDGFDRYEQMMGSLTPGPLGQWAPHDWWQDVEISSGLWWTNNKKVGTFYDQWVQYRGPVPPYSWSMFGTDDSWGQVYSFDRHNIGWNHLQWPHVSTEDPDIGSTHHLRVPIFKFDNPYWGPDDFYLYPVRIRHCQRLTGIDNKNGGAYAYYSAEVKPGDIVTFSVRAKHVNTPVAIDMWMNVENYSTVNEFGQPSGPTDWTDLQFGFGTTEEYYTTFQHKIRVNSGTHVLAVFYAATLNDMDWGESGWLDIDNTVLSVQPRTPCNLDVVRSSDLLSGHGGVENYVALTGRTEIPTAEGPAFRGSIRWEDGSVVEGFAPGSRGTFPFYMGEGTPLPTIGPWHVSTADPDTGNYHLRIVGHNPTPFASGSTQALYVAKGMICDGSFIIDGIHGDPYPEGAMVTFSVRAKASAICDFFMVVWGWRTGTGTLGNMLNSDRYDLTTSYTTYTVSGVIDPSLNVDYVQPYFQARVPHDGTEDIIIDVDNIVYSIV